MVNNASAALQTYLATVQIISYSIPFEVILVNQTVKFTVLVYIHIFLRDVEQFIHLEN